MALVKKVGWIVGWIAGLLGFDVWTIILFVQSIRSGSSEVIGGWERHPPFFLLLFCVGFSITCGLIGLFFWSRIRRMIPSNRLYDLSDDANQIFEELMLACEAAERPFITGKTEARMREMMHRLNKLGVRYPPLDSMKWIYWLPKMIAWSHTKDISGARKHKS